MILRIKFFSSVINFLLKELIKLNDNNIFKVGKLQNLRCQIEIEELENGCLDFFIYSNFEPEYSLEFKSTITKEEFLLFEIGKDFNLLEFIDPYNVVVGENNKFNLDSKFDFKIIRYVSHSFLLVLLARTLDTYLYIEKEFKL